MLNSNSIPGFRFKLSTLVPDVNLTPLMALMVHYCDKLPSDFDTATKNSSNHLQKYQDTQSKLTPYLKILLSGTNTITNITFDKKNIIFSKKIESLKIKQYKSLLFRMFCTLNCNFFRSEAQYLCQGK